MSLQVKPRPPMASSPPHLHKVAIRYIGVSRKLQKICELGVQLKNNGEEKRSFMADAVQFFWEAYYPLFRRHIP